LTGQSAKQKNEYAPNDSKKGVPEKHT
jgi:hypothetical protein